MKLLLKALVDYYELLSSQEDSEVAKRGFSIEKVSYGIDLSKDGELLGITLLKVPDDKGKKLVPRQMKVPEKVQRSSGISASFLCDNSSFVFGFDSKGNPERSKKCLLAFKELHEQILSKIDNVEAQAVVKFLNKWKVEEAADNPFIKKYKDDILKGGNFVFRIDGAMIHENSRILDAWLDYSSNDNDTKQQRCIVTGRQDSIARLHPLIKGLYNGKTVGNRLVSFNATAYESYGKKQGENSPTGEYAAFAYGTALNSLLADKKHKMLIGDTTVVYWAETLKAEFAATMEELLQGPKITDGQDDKVEDIHAVYDIQTILKRISQGQKTNYSDNLFKDETKIFIVGLSPNAARISVRFYIEDSLGKFATKMIKHYEDMAIQKKFPNEFDSIPIWKVVSETVPGNSKDKKPSPLLAGAFLRAILEGKPYPENLYRTMLDRIRAEHDITYVKASIFKGYLIRKYNNNEKIKEVLTMALNPESNNKAYLLGRLFSVLEKAQKDANPGIKSTISEKYLPAACSTPGKVFPILLNLSMSHTAKSEYGARSRKNIEEIMAKFEVENNPFPKTFKLDDQAIFYLGYYQQNPENYKKTKEE